ncbi:histidine phosphatase family protein [Dermacoccus nishinomiyaensis]|uniref:histidine phosphatase family protein n=1 Tax=Dermacoccus nishinomiyaensis TaxID=1274 RepID=UPI00248EA1D6|nr:histidine phosphatase family protein [Dermacoccus nishinomiyaensis]
MTRKIATPNSPSPTGSRSTRRRPEAPAPPAPLRRTTGRDEVDVECSSGTYVRALARELDERSSDEQGGSGVGVVVSHGDVIKSMLSDALGQHLDDFQRIVLAPASMSVIRFVGDRPFVLAMNVTSGGLGEAVGLARSTSAESTVGGATGATQ